VRWVSNIPYTAGERCGCHDCWLDHFYDLSGSVRVLCATIRCGNPVEVGAHVSMEGNDRELIAPLCHSCNWIAPDEEFAIDERVLLVLTELGSDPREWSAAKVVLTGLGIAACVGTVVGLIHLATRPKAPPVITNPLS
jgi:hypothetical protein